jgi:transcriptional regulator with XRE-family HTH domain
MGRRSKIRTNIGELRERLNLTRGEFSKLLALDKKSGRTPHLEALESGRNHVTPELAWQCALLFGVSIESIMRNDRKLLNIRGEPWVQEDGPPSEEDVLDLVISTGCLASEALDPLFEKLRSLEEGMDPRECCAVVRETLLEISLVALRLAAKWKKLADA